MYFLLSFFLLCIFPLIILYVRYWAASYGSRHWEDIPAGTKSCLPSTNRTPRRAHPWASGGWPTAGGAAWAKFWWANCLSPRSESFPVRSSAACEQSVPKWWRSSRTSLMATLLSRAHSWDPESSSNMALLLGYAVLIIIYRTHTHTTHNTQHTTHNTQHTTHNTQHTTHNTQHTTHNTQHTTHNTHTKQDSAFTLCPTGNSPETIRLADALESGSIPVVEDAPYLKAFPEPPPFVVVPDWRTAPIILQDILKDTGKLLALQRANIVWWQRYKQCIRADLEIIIDMAFAAQRPYTPRT